MSKVCFGLIFSLFFSTVSGQEANLAWAKSIGGNSADMGNSIAIDNSHNVLVTGSFQFLVDFDPGSNTSNLIANNGTDIFIQKLDSNGNFLWAKSIGGSDHDAGLSITSDGQDNVLTTGYFQGTADFDPSSSIFNMTSEGLQDIFVQKLDADGNFLWAVSIGDSLWDEGYSITTDGNDNVYITGYFNASADFDPGASSFILNSDGSNNPYILKLDPNGNLVWAKSLQGGLVMGNGRSLSISLDPFGNVYTAGYFSQGLDFDPGTGSYIVDGGMWSNIYVHKMDSMGEFIWVKDIGSASSEYGYSIVTDPWGNLFVTGAYQTLLYVDLPDTNYYITSVGNNDVFVIKLDSNGNMRWGTSLGGSSDDFGYSIASDNYGAAYITGYFKWTADADPWNNTLNITSAGMEDVFIQKLDSSGNLEWAHAMGGNDYDEGASITTDASNNVYLTGSFSSQANFDPGPTTFNVSSNGLSDVFIVKLNQSSAINSIPNNSFFNLGSVFPNPTSGQLNISLYDLKHAAIKVFSVSNHLIYHKENITANPIRFNLNVAPGIYFLEISSQEKKQYYKLVKQ